MFEPTDATSPSQQAHEDAFFILRECRELFQQRLVDIARQSGVSSPSAIEAFAREAGVAHDELASAAQQDGFGQTAGLTASRISLIGNDDLELDIRIGNIANVLKDDDRIDHWRVQLRYMSLLNRPKMAAENNPVGLDPICRGLLAICRESGLNLEQNLNLLGRLEEQLQLQLPEVYSELNKLLESHHVEPAPVQLIRRGNGSAMASGGHVGSPGGSPGGGSGNAASGQPGTNALASLQQALQKQQYPEDSSPGFSPANAANNVALNASALVMLNHMMERLSALELQQPAGALHGTPTPGSAQNTLRALKSKDLDLPLGQSAAVTLDTLSHIFEAIFTTPDLPDVVKDAIGRLQIPLLKLAILDASFFADTQHPGRQLINRMARVAIGLAQDTGRENPICAHLGKLAENVRNTLELDSSDLSAYIEELDVLIAERDGSIQNNASPYAQLVRAHEAKEVSLSNAQDWLDKILGKTIPPELVAFLSDLWLRVMQSAYVQGGTEGARWKECSATIDELVWSVRPKPSPEERKRLVAQIPALLKRINAGLDLPSISAGERAPFLNTCFELQTAALRSRLEPTDPSAQISAEPLIAPMAFTEPSTPRPVSEPTVHLLEDQGKLVQYLGLPTGAASPWRSGSGSWKKGDWITFYLPDDDRLCGHHCGQIAPSATVLLYNPEWGYAVALAPSLLDQQLRSGRARIVSESSLFDEAAERALGVISPR